MINNRQAGRRRGRNNNPRQNGGGNRGNGDSGNRIDNRARGNATQLLEKYRNMARDAQLAGDRVNAEYYLQFADHYFRVLADNRARQDEQQQRFQRNDAPIDGYDMGDESEDGMDEGDDALSGEHEFQPQQSNGRDRDGQQGRRYENRGEGRDNRNEGRNEPREGRNEARGEGRNDARGEGRSEENRDRNREPNRDRDNRRDAPREDRGNRRDAAPREDRRPRIANDDRDEANDEGTISLAALPPAIGRSEEPIEDVALAPETTDEAAPAKPRRGRPRRQAEAAE